MSSQSQTAARDAAIGAEPLAFRVPTTRRELKRYLQAALEVEHLTIPPYLTAMYTIKPGTNSTAYYAIRSVVLEEMLHMTLVANLLNAIGGRPQVAHPRFVRRYPAKLPYSAIKLDIALQHFSPEAMRTFLVIERPKYVAGEPGENTVKLRKGWTSIGQFYDYIREGLLILAAKEKGKTFSGPPERQVGPEDFYNSGGEVFPITDLDSALLALRVVSEQGEGVSETIWDSDDRLFGEQRQPAHYFRFNEILVGRAYGPHDTPSTPPSGPPVNVTWDDVYRIDPKASVAQYRGCADHDVYRRAVAFNDVYARLLTLLHLAFNDQPRWMALAVPAMLELRDHAEHLYHNPHPDPRKAERGIFASATFEIDQPTLRAARTSATAMDAGGLSAGAPIDLSRIGTG